MALYVKKVFSFQDIVHILVLLLFIVPIILLAIIALVRVFWLWIYISFSPLIILDYVFGSKYISSNKNLKISNVV